MNFQCLLLTELIQTFLTLNSLQYILRLHEAILNEFNVAFISTAATW